MKCLKWKKKFCLSSCWKRFVFGISLRRRDVGDNEAPSVSRCSTALVWKLEIMVIWQFIKKSATRDVCPAEPRLRRLHSLTGLNKQISCLWLSFMPHVTFEKKNASASVSESFDYPAVFPRCKSQSLATRPATLWLVRAVCCVWPPHSSRPPSRYTNFKTQDEVTWFILLFFGSFFFCCCTQLINVG